MGYYINENSKGEALQPQDKAQQLIKDGAVKIPEPTEFIPNLVCVVQNGPFDAAAFAYSKGEMDEFKYPDGRIKTWLTYEPAAKISGYTK